MLNSSAWRKARSTYSPPIQRRRIFSPSVYALLFFAGAFLAIASSIGSGNDLEKIAGGILEVDATAAEEAVDLAVARLAGIGPIVEAPRPDAAEDLVEVPLAHQEGVVLHLDLLVGLEEGEGHLVRRLDVEEGPEGDRLREAEDLGIEVRRGLLVARVDDGV